jgi:hypothetical protein
MWCLVYFSYLSNEAQHNEAVVVSRQCRGLPRLSSSVVNCRMELQSAE